MRSPLCCSILLLALLIPRVCPAQVKKVNNVHVAGRNENVKIVNIQDGANQGGDASVTVGGLTVDEKTPSVRDVYIDSSAKDVNIYNRNSAVSIGAVRPK